MTDTPRPPTRTLQGWAIKVLQEVGAKRRVKFSESGALLMGKLFDDKGHRMGPSFSSKNGVRYHFYVSTALRGRKQNAGSVTRVSAPEIVQLVEAALSEKLQAPREEMLDHVERIMVSADRIRVTLLKVYKRRGPIDIPWMARLKGIAQVRLAPENKPDQKLLKSIVRAHAWLGDLSEGRYTSVEELAAAANLHPKVIRQGLRLAFLAPAALEVVLRGDAVQLKLIPKLLPLSWREQSSSMA